MVGASFALPQVFIADTPEVQAERQRFFQLYNTAAAAAAAAPDDNQIAHQASSHSTFRAAPQTTVWRGPLAATIPAGVNGALSQVQDTPDVIAARQAFERAFQQQVRATAPQQQVSFSSPHSSFHHSAPVQQQKWTGPLAATVPAGLPGSTSQVRNTPEVEAAIAQFTQAYNDAVRATAPAASSHSNSFSHQAHSNSFSHQAPSSSHHRFSSPQHSVSVGQQPWTGPLASSVPAGLPGSGPVADTAEVAAAKNSFLRAFHQQLSSVHG